MVWVRTDLKCVRALSIGGLGARMNYRRERQRTNGVKTKIASEVSEVEVQITRPCSEAPRCGSAPVQNVPRLCLSSQILRENDE